MMLRRRMISEKDDNVAEDEVEEDDVEEDKVEDDEVEDDDVKGEEDDDVETHDVEEGEDDDVEDEDLSQDREPLAKKPPTNPLCASLRSRKAPNISQEPLHTEICRKNAAAQIEPATRRHTLYEPAQSKCTVNMS